MSNEIVKGVSGEGQGVLEAEGAFESAGVGAGSVGGQVAGVGQEAGQGVGPQEGGLEEFVGALSAKQQVVLRGILQTGNVSEVSRSTGVGRTTIYHWMRDDERFEAALNAWKRETMRVSRAQAVALAGPCMEAVRAAVSKGDADLAFRVGKSMGVFSPPRVGPDEAGEVRMRKARKAKARKVQNAKKEKESVEEAGDMLKCVKTIYEIDELIEHLMLARMKALREEEAGERVAREKNQRVLRKGDERLEGIARVIREGSEGNW